MDGTVTSKRVRMDRECEAEAYEKAAHALFVTGLRGTHSLPLAALYRHAIELRIRLSIDNCVSLLAGVLQERRDRYTNPTKASQKTDLKLMSKKADYPIPNILRLLDLWEELDAGSRKIQQDIRNREFLDLAPDHELCIADGPLLEMWNVALAELAWMNLSLHRRPLPRHAWH